MIRLSSCGTPAFARPTPVLSIFDETRSTTLGDDEVAGRFVEE